jgi:hypothetical protein
VVNGRVNQEEEEHETTKVENSNKTQIHGLSGFRLSAFRVPLFLGCKEQSEPGDQPEGPG